MKVSEKNIRNLIREAIIEESLKGKLRANIGGTGIHTMQDFTSNAFSQDTGEDEVSSSLSQDDIGRARSATIQSSEKLDRFFIEVLAGLSVPPSNYTEALKLFRAQARLENAASRNNPLATTLGGSSYNLDPINPVFNSVGVKNYATFNDGVRATIDTFINQRYAYKYESIINGLRSGMTAVNILTNSESRDGFDTWGGSSGGRYADKVIRILSAGNVSVPPRMNIDDSTGPAFA